MIKPLLILWSCFTILQQALCMPIRSSVLSAIITDVESVDKQSFDYVIVGGGLTGLVAANRLSEDSDKKILVVEAGDDTRLDEKIVSFAKYTQAFGIARYDWNFPTTPQQLSNNKIYRMHQGRGLGGSTSINGGAFTLPPSSQVDALSSLGNDGWSFDDLLGYMKTSQKYYEPSSEVASLGATADMQSHGKEGPVSIGFSDHMFTGPQEKAFLDAQKAGFNAPKLEDLGNGMSGGAALIPQTTLPYSGSNRTRVSSAVAYLTDDVEQRSNLFVLLKTRASRMLFRDDANLSADIVELQNQKDGLTYQVHADRVILAAGAIRTPMFLEHSGVGDKSILERIGVDTKLSLAGVGKNLCEQQKNNVIAGPPKFPVGGQDSPSSAISMNTITQLMNNASAVQDYIESNLDSWAQNAVENGASASKDGLLQQYRLMVEGIFHKDWPIAETFFISTADSFIQQMWALLSFSRGYVHSKTSSTWDAPELNPRYWSASVDMDFQVAANRGARKLFLGDSLKDVSNGPETSPGFDESSGGITQDSNFGSDEAWKKYILDNFESVWHPIGTAAMLPESSGGVVDSNFKVHNIENVYIIDSSIIPMQMSTHLSSILYGIAEKAVAYLKSSSL